MNRQEIAKGSRNLICIAVFNVEKKVKIWGIGLWPQMGINLIG